MPDRNPAPEKETNIQKAFDRAAEGLGLRLEPAPGSGEVRHVGKAFFISKGVEVDTVDSPPLPGGVDDAAIQNLLHTVNSLTPQQIGEQWTDFYHDPFDAVGNDFLVRMNQQAIKKWLRSEELEHHLQEFPHFEPRQVQITNLQIVYIGPVRAVATYHLQEQFQNGVSAAGNSFALLVKLDEGWRILVTASQEMTAPPPQ